MLRGVAPLFIITYFGEYFNILLRKNFEREQYKMDTFYQNPPRYEGVRQHLAACRREFKQVRLFTVGKSVLGRKLYAVGMGNMKNAVLYAGGIHAQEWITTSLLLRFFDELCTEGEMYGVQLEEIWENRGLIVLPLCNPDGVEIALGGVRTARHLSGLVEQLQAQSERSWQANARGVDLNHNFDAGFSELRKMEEAGGINGPGPRQYGGRLPGSEPETRAMMSVCIGLNVKKVFAYHSQGEEIYYDYGENTPANARLLADALAACSGYRVCKPEGLASHGGFKDWFIQATGRPGFTIEVGKGENPLPITDLEPIYQKLRELLLIGILI